MNKLSRQMAGMSGRDKARAVKEMGAGMGGMAGMAGMGGMPGLRTKGSSFASSPKDRFKKRKR